MVLGKLDSHIKKKMKLGNYLASYTKLNSNWIKKLYIKPEIIKVLEENIGNKLLDIGFSNKLLDLITKAKATKINT